MDYPFRIDRAFASHGNCNFIDSALEPVLDTTAEAFELAGVIHWPAGAVKTSLVTKANGDQFVQVNLHAHSKLNNEFALFSRLTSEGARRFAWALNDMARRIEETHAQQAATAIETARAAMRKGEPQ